MVNQQHILVTDIKIYSLSPPKDFPFLLSGLTIHVFYVCIISIFSYILLKNHNSLIFVLHTSEMNQKRPPRLCFFSYIGKNFEDSLYL